MSDLQTLQNSLAKKQAELAILERELEAARDAQFTTLPAQLGLGSIDAVIKALAGYASPRLQRALRNVIGEKAVVAAPRTGVKPEALAKVGQRKRARITPGLKEEIVKALQAGGKTAAAVAAEFGVSVAAINLIKKAAGLTKRKG